MPRHLRVLYPGVIYHVTARGNGRQAIFYDDADRERLLERLAESVESYGVCPRPATFGRAFIEVFRWFWA